MVIKGSWHEETDCFWNKSQANVAEMNVIQGQEIDYYKVIYFSVE